MARAFDGDSANYLYTDTVPITTRPLTMSCRFQVNSFTNEQTFIFLGDKDAAGNRDTYSLRILSSSHPTNAQQIQFLTSDSTNFNVAVSGSAAGSTGTWYTAIGGISAGGTAVPKAALRPPSGTGWGTGTTTYHPSNIDRLAIGLESTTGGNSLDGNIAEVAIWNALLIEEEVDSLQWFSPLLVRPANLVFYTPLIRDEDADYVSGIALTENGTLSIAPHTAIRRPISQMQ